ncbi:MAG: NUDIX hydrolase [Armatimonadetes bacterium]|nr:MAG: NUDIX hydrolase [Armatimonadota bacterium]
MKISSVYIVALDNRNKILLTKRADIPLWVLPGGQVEEGENAKAAAVREFCEETGLKIKVIKTIACYTNIANGNIKYLFLAGVIGGNETLSNETEALRWVSLKSLPHPMTLYEMKKINDLICYRNRIIVREDKVDRIKEVLYQIKSPIIFGYLLFRALKLLVLGKKSFSFRV